MNRLTCELCGANDFTKDKEGLFVCDFCQAKYTPEQAKGLLLEGTVKIDKTDDIGKYLTMANHSFESDNYQEAYTYANKILEINHEHPEAWFLKGASAGYLSTTSSLRVSEMINAFNMSIKASDSDSRADIKKKSVESAFALSNGMVNLIAQNIEEMVRCSDPYNVNSWDLSFWNELLLSGEASLQLQSFILENTSEDEIKLNTINAKAVLADNILNGLSNKPDARGLIGAAMNQETKQLKAFWESEKAKAVDEAKQINPDAKVGNDSCFVVTATTGSDQSRSVLILRSFRDEVLTHTAIGKNFISWYYNNGPYLADIIRDSRWLRAFSLVLIVLPASGFALVALGLSHLAKRR